MGRVTRLRTTELGRLGAWAGVAGLSSYLVFLGGGFAGIYSAQLRAFSLAAAAAALAIWAVVAVARPRWRPQTTLWPAFAVSLAAFALSSVTSATPRMSAEYLGFAVILLALYLLLQRLLADSFFRSRLGNLAVFLCLAVSLAYVVRVAELWSTWWSLVGRIAVPPLRPWFESLQLGNPSAVMTVCVLLLGPALASLGFATPWRRGLAAALVGLVLLVTLLSGSRAGWLGLAVSCVLFAAGWVADPCRRAGIASAWTGRRRMVLAGVAGGLALLAIAIGPAILGRLTAGGEAVRGSFYSATVRMALDHPLLGSGPGSWPILRAAHTLPSEVDYYIPHAHNLYLEVASDFGLAGIVAGIVAILMLFRLIRGALGDQDPMRRRMAWAALFGSLYFGAHQLLDFYPNMPAALLAFAIPIAWLDATAPSPVGPSLPAPARRIATLGLVVAVAVAVAFEARSEAVAMTATAAVQAADDGDWEGALRGAREVSAADPDIPAYQLLLGLGEARLGTPDAAAGAFRRVAATDQLPEAWLDLAVMEERLGDVAGARTSIEQALRLGSQQPIVLLGAAQVLVRLGDTPAAIDALSGSIAGQPSLAGDPWLRAAPEFVAILDTAVLKAQQLAAPLTAWQIALEAGDAAGARRIASALDPETAASVSLVIDAWGGNETAVASLRDRARARPLDVLTVVWLVRLEERRGDTAEVQRYRAWANGVDGFSGSSAGGSRVTVALEPGDPVRGSLTGFYGYYTYRRAVPVDQLVPGLPSITIP